MFDVILFCLLRTSEKFQKLRRSLTTNKVAVRMIACGEGCRLCDAILFMVKKPPEAKYSVILEPLEVDDLVNPLNVLGFPIVLFLSWNYGFYSLYVYARSVILCSSAFYLYMI